MKVVTIGGATQDIFLTCKTTDQITLRQRDFTSRYIIFNPQDKVEATDITYATGGGATNSAVSFNAMGFQTTCFCNIGNDTTGSYIIKELEEYGIDTSLINKTDTEVTGASLIINNADGDRVLLAYRGANNNLVPTQKLLDTITSSDLIYITSLSNQSAKHLPAITKHAHQHNVTVAVNPGKSQLTETGLPTLKTSLQNIDILILNFNEAKRLTMSLIENDLNYKKALSANPLHRGCATKISDEQPYLIDHAIPHKNLFFNLRSFFNETLKLGPSIVIITNGCNGVYLATKRKVYFHPSMKVPIKDTVGAGDSFGSAFVGNWKQSGSIEQALRNGIANSSSVLQHIGAKQGLLSIEEQTKITQTINKDLLQVLQLDAPTNKCTIKKSKS